MKVTTSRPQLDVRNPVTGELAGTVADMAGDIPAMVARAHVAQQEWAACPLAQRVAVLKAMRGWVVERREALVRSTMAETGKTFEDALSHEVIGLADLIRFWAAVSRRTEPVPKTSAHHSPGFTVCQQAGCCC